METQARDMTSFPAANGLLIESRPHLARRVDIAKYGAVGIQGIDLPNGQERQITNG